MASNTLLAPRVAPNRPAPRLAAQGERSLGARAELRDWRQFDNPAELVRWDALAQWASEPNPFFESWYLLPSLEALDPAGEVRLLCVEVDGQLIGLLPVKRELSYYGRPLPHWQAWLHANTFCGHPLVAAGAEHAFWRAALTWADGAGATPLFWHLPRLPLDGRVHAALRDVLGAQRRPARLVHRYERAFLRTDMGPRDYFEASLNPKRRKELRRREKRLAERGRLELERRTGPEGIEPWIDEFLELESSGWKGKAGSALVSQSATIMMFRNAMRRAAERGRLERLTLRLDGRAIACLTSLLAGPGAFGYKTAYDEAFARSSPGVLLQREFLDILERPDIEWCDSCAAPDHPMIDHFWRERRTIGRINVALGGPVRRKLFETISQFEKGTSAGVVT